MALKQKSSDLERGSDIIGAKPSFTEGRPAAQEGWRQTGTGGPGSPGGVGLPLPPSAPALRDLGSPRGGKGALRLPLRAREESELRLAALIHCLHCKLRSVHAQVRSAGRYHL